METAEKELSKAQKVSLKRPLVTPSPRCGPACVCPPIMALLSQAISKSKKKGELAALLERHEQEKLELQTQQQGLLSNLAEVG